MKAILLIAAEVVDALVARGYPLFYGAMGENLTTRGIEIRDLRVGDQTPRRRRAARNHPAARPLLRARYLRRHAQARGLRQAGEAARSVSPRWGMSGFYASVVAPGPVQAGDAVSLVSKLRVTGVIAP